MQTALQSGEVIDAIAGRILRRSLGMALLATALATLLGVPWGWALARFRCPARRLCLAGGVAPLLLPPYAAAVAWIHLLRPSAWLGGWLAHWGLPPLGAYTPFSTVVSAAVLALCFWPVVGWSVYLAARSVPAELEEEARLNASSGRAILASGWSFVGPALAAAALGVFLLTLADYGVANALGARSYPVEIVLRFQIDRRPGPAAAMALPWLGVVISLMAVQWGWLRRWRYASGGTGGAALAQSTGGQALGLVASGFAWALATLIPLGSLAWFAESWEVFPSVWRENQTALLTSLALGASTAALVLVLAATFEWLAVQDRARPLRGAPWAAALGVLPYALPGSLVAVALTAMLNRPGLLGDWYNGGGVLIWAYAALFLPFALLLPAPGWARLDPALREAAALEGANAWQRFWISAWPTLRPIFAVAGLLVFLLAGREMDATALLRPPGVETAAFAIHDYLHYQPQQRVAALCLLLVAMLGAVTAVVAAWVSRGERD